MKNINDDNLIYCLDDNLSLKLESDTKIDHKNSEKKFITIELLINLY